MRMDEDHSFDTGEFLKSKRLAKGLTHKELAALSGVSQAYISVLENGRKPTKKVIDKLAPYLDISNQELIKLTNSSNTKSQEIIIGSDFDFGEYLRNKRIAKELTMGDLATISSVSQSYISYIERGRTPFPSSKILRKLAPHLGISKEDLTKLLDFIEASEYKTELEPKPEQPTENLFVFDLEGLTPEDIENIKKQIEDYKNKRKTED